MAEDPSSCKMGTNVAWPSGVSWIYLRVCGNLRTLSKQAAIGRQARCWTGNFLETLSCVIVDMRRSSEITWISRVMADTTVYRKVVDSIHNPDFLSNCQQAHFTRNIKTQPLQCDEKIKTVGVISRKRTDLVVTLEGAKSWM